MTAWGARFCDEVLMPKFQEQQQGFVICGVAQRSDVRFSVLRRVSRHRVLNRFGA